MSKNTKVRILLVSISLVALVLALMIISQSRILFERKIGKHTLRISKNYEVRVTGEKQCIYQVSFIESPRLMYASRPYPVARGHVPEFELLEVDELACLFDEAGSGLLVLIDKSTGDWFMTSKESPTGGETQSEFERWRKQYAIFKTRHSHLPYSEYFERTKSEMNDDKDHE